MHRENKKIIIKEGVDVWFKVSGVRQKSGAVHIDGKLLTSLSAFPHLNCSGTIEEANLGPISSATS